MTGTTGTAPLVGISSYAEPARWGPWQLPCALLPLAYAEQVAAAGGVPVLLPPLPGETAAVGRLDAVILSGGGDLDPAGYGAPPHPETTRVQPERDRAELDLLAAALAARVPVLAICRGLQIVNTWHGGTLRQHLPDTGGHRAAPGTFGTHQVRVAPGSRLASLLGPPADGGGERWLDVPTAHHQAIGRLGDGLVATAWAADGTIEAVEFVPPRGAERRSGAGGSGGSPPGKQSGGSSPRASTDRDEFLIAVQWHPEQGTDPRLFQALLAAARRRVPGSANRAPAEPLDSPA